MTGSEGVARGPRAGLVGAPSLWVRLLRRRLREPGFWAIQGGVIAITAFHLGLEAFDPFAQTPAVESGLHHVPVILYLVPVVYAGLRYGFEGGVLTGAWCVVLTLPNVFLWHSGGYLWVSELLFVSFVIGSGVAVAVPVERERRQRERVVATSRRLALLNEVASALVSSSTFDRALPAVLGRLREVLGLDSVGFVVREPGDPVESWWATGERDDRAPTILEEEDLVALQGGIVTRRDGRVIASIGGGGVAPGALVAVPDAMRPLRREDEELLVAVAGQIGVALDNARLHRLEKDRLRSYVHEVTRVQEEERKHLARELHDTAAQDLVLLSRGLDALAGGDAPPGSAERRLTELRVRAGETLENLRRLSRDLRPTVLDDLGLVPALEWLAVDLTQRTGIRAEFRLSGAPRRLPAETELALFRITQEALRNVERHAGAARVEVEAAFDADGVRVDVTDDGRGFEVPEPPERLAGSGKLGILGMRERAELVGGSLAIHSRPGEGTRVSVAVVPPAGRAARATGAEGP